MTRLEIYTGDNVATEDYSSPSEAHVRAQTIGREGLFVHFAGERSDYYPPYAILRIHISPVK